MARQERPRTTRSPKAGRPPAERAQAPQARRRRRSARAALVKDTMLLQAGKVTRATWGATAPKIKKGKGAP